MSPIEAALTAAVIALSVGMLALAVGLFFYVWKRP